MSKKVDHESFVTVRLSKNTYFDEGKNLFMTAFPTRKVILLQIFKAHFEIGDWSVERVVSDKDILYEVQLSLPQFVSMLSSVTESVYDENYIPATLRVRDGVVIDDCPPHLNSFIDTVKANISDHLNFTLSSGSKGKEFVARHTKEELDLLSDLLDRDYMLNSMTDKLCEHFISAYNYCEANLEEMGRGVLEKKLRLEELLTMSFKTYEDAAIALETKPLEEFSIDELYDAVVAMREEVREIKRQLQVKETNVFEGKK